MSYNTVFSFRVNYIKTSKLLILALFQLLHYSTPKGWNITFISLPIEGRIESSTDRVWFYTHFFILHRINHLTALGSYRKNVNLFFLFFLFRSSKKCDTRMCLKSADGKLAGSRGRYIEFTPPILHYDKTFFFFSLFLIDLAWISWWALIIDNLSFRSPPRTRLIKDGRSCSSSFWPFDFEDSFLIKKSQEVIFVKKVEHKLSNQVSGWSVYQ